MVWEILGESLLSALFGALFERLASPLVRNFFGDRDFDQTLFDKMKTVLLTVNAVLSDAEEKQITNMAVKEWVNELKDAAYHAEDLLDEIATIALQCELEAEAKVKGKQVMGLFFTHNPSKEDKDSSLKLDKDMESRLKNIVERLEFLAQQRDIMNFKESVRGKPLLVLPTTSLVDEFEVFGRDKDKEKLKEFLLAGNAQKENRIPVIAIVGIGGVGKTTLAQLLYNDSEVEKSFNFRAWAYVSEEFDVLKITRTIFESVASRNCNVKDLNVLQVKLKERLKGKRFLLVLDDIWNDNFIDWDLLLSPLKAGARGSRIIVTTRNQSVASMMRAVVTYRLLHLSDEDCWSLFAKHAFRTSNPEEHPTLKRIGEKIVKKCKGLPLATKVLGGLLHPEVEAEEWNRILNSKIWELSTDKSSILRALMLSYYHLPPHLKQCFSYCSIFPKGYEFEKEKLVLMWMAEGFLQHRKGKDTMEDVGCRYFRELISRSFFQPSNRNKLCFVMHDLINDLAQFASGEFCCKFEDGKLNEISEKARYFAWSINRLDGPEIFVALQEVKSLRTFLPLGFSNTSQCSALSKIVSDKWLPFLKHLRVLSFACHVITDLPETLGKLIHLRYLDLSQTSIKQLPSSICSLYNLQTLLLASCIELTELPANFGNLINLRHLDVSETNLREMPLEFGRLKSLQVLTDFFVSRNSGPKISELGKLAHLRTISISRVQNVVDATDASEADLKSKHYLNELAFTWTSNTHEVQNEIDILDNLQPHKNLKKLTIENYGGSRFPNWLGDAIFSNMVFLCLSKCKICTSLPPLGHLSSLQGLYIIEMEGLKRLDSGFYGNGHFGVKPFRSLRTLLFEELPSWTHWIHLANEGEHFPSLQQLHIRGCPKLIGTLPKHLRSLKEMKLHHLDSLTTLSQELFEGNSSFQRLEIVNCPSLSSFPGGDSLNNVKKILICDCQNLKPFLLEHTMHPFRALESLQIMRSCDSLQSLPLGLFTKLQDLHIEDCRNLKALSIPNNLHLDLTFLRKMKFKDCPNLEFFPEKGLPTPNLQSLLITNCNNLMPQKEWGLHRMVSLTCFEIEGGCSNLELFPEEGLLPNTLTSLRISRLPHLKFIGQGLQHLTLLGKLEINCCEKLELMPEEGLPASLFSLHIQNCSLLADPCQKDGTKKRFCSSVFSSSSQNKKLTMNSALSTAFPPP
ncbi:hypothetical protein ACB098_11G167900 [Castanea mollissima]